MKKIFGILAALVMGLGVFTGVSANTTYATSGVEIMAKDCTVVPFFGFYPWYYGLPADDNCNIVPQQDSGDGQGVSQFVWTIVLNVVADMMLAVGYIAVGVTIWGGFYMITSNGDPGKVTKARKILVGGVSGALIAIFASVIAHVMISILVQT